MSEQLVKRAKVTLKGSKSYTLGGQQFVKDVPVIVKGSLVDQFAANGYFKCVHLEAKAVEKSEKSSGLSSKKKLKKKSSSKKVT